jgi:hypothetical protein
MLVSRMCVVATVGASLALAGCGSISGNIGAAAGPSASPTAALALCTAVKDVDSLTVSRVIGFPQNHIRFTFPPRVEASSPEQARIVARMVCGLPRMPGGPMSCPADLGISYRLDFGAAGRRFPVVTLDSGGCQEVAGAGPERWAGRSPGFWGVLGRATDVVNPETAFGGCGNQGSAPCQKNATYTA